MMERFKVSDLGAKKVLMAFDNSGWRVIDVLAVKASGACPACGANTALSPGVYYTVPRPKNKGKDALMLCSHAPDEVENAKKILASL
ncbi:MAG TPA: hypothetical protein VNN62_19635 [Methylomirabilota bacterium]|nr:hypothetical protein [Methylomirabilota bacterium]